MVTTHSVASAHTASVQNARKTNQDRAVVDLAFCFAADTATSGDRSATALLLVLDGHGSNGGDVADYVAKHLPHTLRTTVDPAELDMHSGAVLVKLFGDVNRALSEQSGIDLYSSGTTASLVLVRGRKIITANVGDSRVVLGRRRKASGTSGGGDESEPGASKAAEAGSTESTHYTAVNLSVDHNWSDEAEVQRAVNLGGRVEPEVAGGIVRVFKGTLPYPGLAMSRSLGDEDAHRIGVSCEPSVSVHELEDEDVLLVLASDGLWETITSKGAVKLVAKQPSMEVALEELMKRSTTIDHADNATVILASFVEKT